ncbi:50S ribosomal protein L24 [Candidatus Gracilibacteria bacterium]|nr:50S ribosomal protein L24 [bacterium]NDK19544.1 50S ribosomal protein L24 [Candidatus Gracilibacteria bacterium]OIO77890.1 MAG: 50S ribosomal protein L24 [Candidatus Gracilibacteria bacterium CG1_02_38_174]PIQ11921.1 MAG: 50S ribosomal protein L24 [Candidatus Gracilibacteria bacterium CG18_big_fil_WC_8_21_14_2_50_38_16]PIQ41240.1 MAG: 50S ribosomal protein L24 [Candidatus Gracilibacteria bacterium CG12_big_fil_rev_8_21_14_0_65_38_15]PIZ01841.1 MAG: 50S ribosomal protein L24 [Candidatus Grac
MRIRSGDMVQVMAGKDKGKKGKVLATHQADNRLVVEGVNIATCHIKKQGTTPGQIVKIEKPIQASNVMILDPETGKPTRIGIKMEGTKKVRVAKKSGKTL